MITRTGWPSSSTATGTTRSATRRSGALVAFRRPRAPGNPAEAAALEVIDRLASIYATLDEAGDRWAPSRRRGELWTRGEFERWGLDCINELRVRGYQREIERLTGPPLPLQPGTYRGPAEP